jgi:hypothetical protein
MSHPAARGGGGLSKLWRALHFRCTRRRKVADATNALAFRGVRNFVQIARRIAPVFA